MWFCFSSKIIMLWRCLDIFLEQLKEIRFQITRLAVFMCLFAIHIANSINGFNVSAVCAKVLSKHFVLHFLASSGESPTFSLSFLFPSGCLRGIYQGCQTRAGPLMRDDWALIIARTNGSRWASISCDLSLSTQMLFLCVCFCANDVVWCLKFTVLGSSLFMWLRICSLLSGCLVSKSPAGSDVSARVSARIFQSRFLHGCAF